MGRYLVIIRCVISTICIVLLLWGCERSTVAPAKPKVVRKKITAQKHRIAKSTLKKAVDTAGTIKVAKPDPKAARAAIKKPAVVLKTKPKIETVEDKRTVIAKKVADPPPPKAAPDRQKQKKPAIRPLSDIADIKPPVKIQKPVPEDKLIAAASQTIQTEKPLTNKSVYDPVGKIDPFKPLFREKQVSVKKKKRKKRVPRTPLERIDLSQLTLVGIILTSSGNMALVEEASGKGYVIKRGTYIGTNAGKVSKINKANVIVEEEFEDVFGKVKIRKREIKLPKPPGEF
jgi:type IV pilus assembly protein PilP